MTNKGDPGIEKLIDTAELARQLGVHPVTLAAWRGQGRGPRFAKVGSRVRYRVSEVEAWLRDQARQSTAEPSR